jgi:tetratricopeptide (TPR) repeat protein
MHYYLGVAYAKSGKLDQAITHLQAALVVEPDFEDVRFQLASALDRSGAYAKARVEYDRFATAHPVSSFTQFALRRSATLARAPAQAPPPNAKPPAAAAGSGSAAPKPVWKPRAPVQKPVAPPPPDEPTEPAPTE